MRTDIVTAYANPAGKIFYQAKPPGDAITLASGPREALSAVIDAVAGRRGSGHRPGNVPPGGGRPGPHRVVPNYDPDAPEDRRREAVELFRDAIIGEVRKRLRADLKKVLDRYARFGVIDRAPPPDDAALPALPQATPAPTNEPGSTLN